MLGFIKTLKKTSPPYGMPIYPYEFNTSGFAHVDKVRSIIEDQPDWDFTFSDAVLIENNIAAAAYFGFGPCFTAEETALGQMLVRLTAGPHIMMYAWGIYDDFIKLESKSH
mgnify:CR=1 FL=1